MEFVCPATVAFPAVSTAMELARSKLLPPKYVEYEIEPVALNFVTKGLLNALSEGWKALAMGKSTESVPPVT